MTAFLSALAQPLLLVVIGWCVVFAVWVNKQLTDRKVDIEKIKTAMAEQKAEFVTREYIAEQKHWQEKMMEKVVGLEVALARIQGPIGG